MVDNKKQNVSVRMSNGDLGKIKGIAKRLNVRESDVLRFAIKATLKKLMPLHDCDVKGVDLVPAFIECGSEMANYFDLDSGRLEDIINDGVVDAKKKVDREDIELLTLFSTNDNYMFIKLKEIFNVQEDSTEPTSLLRQYLYEKYIQRSAMTQLAGAVK